MRNVFDQYTQPENRLTHAVAYALWADRTLLRRFVHWVTGERLPRTAALVVIEQGLPGDPPMAGMEAEERGLPDVCIHDGEDWALIIESKINAPLSIDQLRRHRATVSRRGLRRIRLLVLGLSKPARPLPPGVEFRSWSQVYAWLVRQSRHSEWAGRAADYFIVAENSVQEGTLTTFTGIPFGIEEPYHYPEAKRLLKLMMEALRGKRELSQVLGMNPRLPGRGAITGRDDPAVWDFLRLRQSERAADFTSYPHLTLAIEQDRLLAITIIPHHMKPQFRRCLTDLGFEGFQAMFGQVNRRLGKALSRARGAAPWVITVQRRYATQRSAPTIDARIEFDLRTAFEEAPGRSAVKAQPEWLEAAYKALSRKRSNLQLAVGASFPYRACTAVNTRKILDYVADTWIACQPLIDEMLGT